LQIFSSGIKALTGVMLIIICAMIPSGIILPQKDLSLSVLKLQSTWQIHGLLLSSIICGPQIGIICAVSYILIGLFYLPIFHGGGSIGYILMPEFGYLLGLIPAAYTCGILSKSNTRSNLINYTFFTIFSLFTLHIIGVIYIVFGNIFINWTQTTIDLILINTIIPLPSQVLMCIPISLLSLAFKRILLIK
tara:strand:- start:201 stop:773 length:573 start_codon:yes stop_codon:yes gene_type:complete